MQNKKIGILTFWNVPNYGCFLQAYALQRSVSELFKDCEVGQLAYLEKQHYNHYYGFFDIKYPMAAINPKFYRHILGQIKNSGKRKIIRQFLNYYREIPNFEYNGGPIDSSAYRVVVFGSDIIWDFSNQVILRERELFGQGIDCTKVAYAPSVGNAVNCDICPDYVKEGIASFNSLAVRDSNSYDTIRRITGLDSQIVLDPTLLYDFREDSKVIAPKTDRAYIHVYGIHFEQSLIDEIVKYADDNNLDIINLSFVDDNEYDWCNRNIKIGEVSPFEWMGYIKHAHALVTSTYHGLIFGINFNKKIIFKATDFIINKLGNLLEDLGISELILSKASFSDRIGQNWDYNTINSKLNDLRERSKQYLQDSLSK